MLPLLIDCDGPLLNFTGGFCAAANELLPPEQHIRPEQITAWDIFSFLPDERAKQEMGDMLRTSWFWSRLPITTGAREGIEQMRSAGVHPVVVTSSWESCERWESVRRRALRDHFGFANKDVIVCSRKDLVRGRVFIDDKPSHVAEWQAAHREGFALLYSLPHNAADVMATARFAWSGEHVENVIAVAKHRLAA